MGVIYVENINDVASNPWHGPLGEGLGMADVIEGEYQVIKDVPQIEDAIRDEDIIL